MLDGSFRNGVDKVTGPIGARIVRLGVTADVLTVTGVLLSVACAFAIATGHFGWGVVLLIGSALPDLLDGPVAKAAGMQSIRGAFFDSVADRITDSLVFGGVGWYLAGNDSPHMVLLPMALLGASQLISYQRAKAEIYTFDAKGGLMERAERIVALGVALTFPSLLVVILWIMLALTVVTGIQRFIKVWRQATDENPVLAARRRETPPLMRNLFDAWNETDERTRRRWREWADEQRKIRRAARNDRKS